MLTYFWMRVRCCHVEMIWVKWRYDKKPNSNLISKLLPLETTIDIPIIGIWNSDCELPPLISKHPYGRIRHIKKKL